jgi:hypothetical protein
VPKLLSSALKLTLIELEASPNALEMEAGEAVVGFSGAVVGVICWNDLAVGGVVETTTSVFVPVGVLHNSSDPNFNPRRQHPRMGVVQMGPPLQATAQRGWTSPPEMVEVQSTPEGQHPLPSGHRV